MARSLFMKHSISILEHEPKFGFSFGMPVCGFECEPGISRSFDREKWLKISRIFSYRFSVWKLFQMEELF